MGVQSSLGPDAAGSVGLPGRSAPVGLPHPCSMQAGREGSALAQHAAGREGSWVCWGLLNGRVVMQREPGCPAAPEQDGDGISR